MADPEQIVLDDRRILDRQHVEAVRRAFEIGPLGRDQLDRQVAHGYVGIEIPHRENLVAVAGEEPDDFGVLQPVGPVDIVARNLENHRRCAVCGLAEVAVGAFQSGKLGTLDVEHDQADPVDILAFTVGVD